MSRNATSGNGATCVKACREVILAAGTPRSPQVLQLSGVGPKQLLSHYGIKTLVDLPGVGQNFQDQPSMFMQFTCESDFTTSQSRKANTSQMAITRSPRLIGSSRTQAGPHSSLRPITRTVQVSRSTLFSPRTQVRP